MNELQSHEFGGLAVLTFRFFDEIVGAMSQPAEQDFSADLTALGITQERLAQVVLFGERRGRDAALAVDPSNYSGLNAYAMRVRALATMLAVHGWRREDIRNQALIVSPDRKQAIHTCAGDERTGRHGLPYPKAAYPRGPVSKYATGNNAYQLNLPGLEMAQVITTLQEKGMYVWALLVCRLQADVEMPNAADEVWYELSLPTKFEDNNFTDFIYRGWLGYIDLSEGSGPGPGLGPGGDDDDRGVDISISRK